MKIAERLAVAAGASAAGLTMLPAFELRAPVAWTVLITSVVVAALLPAGWWAVPALLIAPAVSVVVSHPAHLDAGLTTGFGRALRLTLPLPPDLVVVPAMLACVAAAAGSVLARRRPGGLDALVPATMTGAYGLVAAGLDDQIVPVCLGLAAAGLLLVAGRRRVGGSMIAALVAAAFAGTPLLIVPQRPAADAADPRDHFRSPARVADSVDVLDQVGGWLSAPAGEVLFTATGGPVQRWRLAVLDDYDGLTWRSSGRPVAAGLGVPPNRGRVPATAVRQTITVESLRGPYLPAVDRPLRIGPPVEALDPDTGVLLTSRSLAAGASYSVTSLPGLSAGAASTAALMVPDGLRPAVGGFVDSVPLRAGMTAAQQADAVETALRQGRRNVRGAPSSAAAPAVAGLLASGGTGTTVQFATAYALAMRLRGVPSRLVIGFAGGATVHARDVRVWTELRDAGGWVLHNPTPPPSEPDKPPPPDGPPPPDVAGPVAPPGAEALSPPKHPPGPGLPWLWIAVAVLVVAMAYLATPVVGRAWRRYRPGPSDARVAAAWREVLNAQVAPPGVSRATLTPGLLHDRIKDRLGAAENAGELLSRLADRALYSTQPCSAADAREAWRSADQVRRALRTYSKARC
ncbi:DUF3488 and transglutaminase-like domain-containing protein [Actinoplanes sp. CA-142083]|uniref:DUF3488 and transglutaminase-like domain-containing protein n=1 Tax=Actinoplanes sp. CA-142083 TaxID=3239903 RepID=UPI003D91FA46